MGLLSRLFGSDTVVETAAKGAYNGLDKMFYTKEERSEDEKWELATRKDFALKMLEMTKSASPARRIIAMIVMTLWFIAGINMLILINLNTWYLDTPLDLTQMVDFTIDYVAKPTGLVLTFYFLKNIIPSGGKSVTEK